MSAPDQTESINLTMLSSSKSELAVHSFTNFSKPFFYYVIELCVASCDCAVNFFNCQFGPTVVIDSSHIDIAMQGEADERRQ